MQAILGIALLISVAWLVSESRKEVVWKYVGIGLGVQFVLAFLFTQVEWIANTLLLLNGLVEQIESATTAVGGGPG